MNPTIQQHPAIRCLGRSLSTTDVHVVETSDAMCPPLSPVQGRLIALMRPPSRADDRRDAMRLWAGQSGWMARRAPTAEIRHSMWAQAGRLL